VDTHEDNKFTVEQWVYNFITTDPAVNNTLPTTTGNTSLILAEELSYTIFIKQPTSTKMYSYMAISLFTLYIYYTQTYYKVTGCYIGTPLNYLERNSNWQFIVDRDHLLRPS
jgi:hypothetical protein